jgi:Zn-dependent protease
MIALRDIVAPRPKLKKTDHRKQARWNHPYLPVTVAQWVAANLKNALILNVVLAVFNLFPLLPLDGGRLVGILPKSLGVPFVRLEPYGLVILIGLLIVLPLLGAQFGVDLNVFSRFLAASTGAIINTVLLLTGNI